MKIYIGSDHAGFELKEELKSYLTNLGHEIDDKGAFSYDPTDDYPDFVRQVAEFVAEDIGSFGIVIGGSGQGEAMVAHRVVGVRCIEYYGGTIEIVKLGREHNDANIISLGARFVSVDDAKIAVKTFLETSFSNEERHFRRINKY